MRHDVVRARHHRPFRLCAQLALALALALVVSLAACRPTAGRAPPAPAASPAPAPGNHPPPASSMPPAPGQAPAPAPPAMPPPQGAPAMPPAAAPPVDAATRAADGASSPDTAAEAPPLHVMAAGDIADPAGDQVKTAAILKTVDAESHLDAILMLGDGAYRFANVANYQAYYEPTWGIPAWKAITHPVPGNHEYLENGKPDGYFDYWNGPGNNDGPAGPRGKGWYSFDLGSWHVIALNSSEDCKFVPCGEGSEQLAWFRAELQRSASARCTLVMVHNPRYQNGTHRGDTEDLGPAWNAAIDAGVDGWVAGHEHNYQQLAPMDKAGKVDRARGIRSWVVGTGGARDFRSEFDDAQIAAEEKRFVNVSGVLELVLWPGRYQWRYHIVDRGIGVMGEDVCH